MKRLAALLLAAMAIFSIPVFAQQPSLSDTKERAFRYLQGKDQTDFYLQASVINGYSPTSGQIGRIVQAIDAKAEYSVEELGAKILNISAIKGDAANASSVNLVQQLSQRNLNSLGPEGLSGLVMSIAAAHAYAGDFENASWDKDSLCQALLSLQKADGGFPNQREGDSDPTATLRALMGLSFYSSQEMVSQAITRATDYLTAQKFAPADSIQAALLVQALGSVGIDSEDDHFATPAGSPLQVLLSFQREDGGFAHNPGDGGSDVSATQQALLALFAAEHQKNPLDAANITTPYQPQGVLASLLPFLWKFGLVLLIIFGSLMLVNRFGKRHPAPAGTPSASQPGEIADPYGISLPKKKNTSTEKTDQDASTPQ